ncbi:hypothetical protein CBR_g32101 [Chara braunii]|uniref:IPT/TIG domain-containing protein n=1 Tax=Chara braunii TaxID=69332 RepID=A0A388LGJ1_CHABU|nr:hypothetical protein CBR_g32101 [Chara braunii]|eukprot:GBG81424.1 hypothetical protein CBR_g32101 [Chara braunii]
MELQQVERIRLRLEEELKKATDRENEIRNRSIRLESKEANKAALERLDDSALKDTARILKASILSMHAHMDNKLDVIQDTLDQILNAMHSPGVRPAALPLLPFSTMTCPYLPQSGTTPSGISAAVAQTAASSSSGPAAGATPQPPPIPPAGQQQPWYPKTPLKPPPTFSGDKKDEALDTWLRTMPVWVRAKRTLVEEEVITVASYLEGSAANWLNGLVASKGFGRNMEFIPLPGEARVPAIHAAFADRSDKECQFSYNSSLGVTISTVNPGEGRVGDMFVISGSGFSAVPSENEVLIGSAAAEVLGANFTNIIAKLSPDAKGGPSSVIVTVNGRGVAVNSGSPSNTRVYAQVLSVTDVQPRSVSAQGNTMVTVSGVGFDSSPPEKISVKINNVTCGVLPSTVVRTSMVCISGPTIPTTSAVLEISMQFVSGEPEVASFSSMSVVSSAVPWISNFGPPSLRAAWPDKLTISGGGFGSIDSTIVQIEEYPCGIETITSNQIVCQPAIIKPGSYNVMVTLKTPDGTITTRSNSRVECFFEFLLSEDRKDLAEMLKVGLEGEAIDRDIIEVNNDTNFEEVTEDVVHGGLECGGGVGESEGHHKELVLPKARTECGLVSVLLANADLVEVTAEVNFGKISGSTEAIKKLGDLRYVIMRKRAARSMVASGAGVCSPARLRAMLSTGSVRMPDISMLDNWAMVGEGAVVAEAKELAADEVEAAAAAAASAAAL